MYNVSVYLESSIKTPPCLTTDADGECLPELILNPPEVLGEYGDTVTVNCSSADSDNFEMYGMVGNTQWQPEYENSVTWNVTLSDWNVTAECVKQLNNTSCRKELKIRIYRKLNFK